MSKNSTITINGRHYDATTGEPLSPAAPRPEHRAAPTHHRIHSVHHAAHHGQHESHEHPVSHSKIGHVAAHHPRPSQTLMRQAVKKPDSELRHRIKVSAHLDSSAERSSSKLLVKSGARQPNVHHMQRHTTKRPKGQLISHFSPDLFTVEGYTAAATYGTAPLKLVASPAPQASNHHAAVKKPQTTAELLEYAVRHGSDPAQPLPRKRHHLFKRRARV